MSACLLCFEDSPDPKFIIGAEGVIRIKLDPPSDKPLAAGQDPSRQRHFDGDGNSGVWEGVKYSERCRSAKELKGTRH